MSRSNDCRMLDFDTVLIANRGEIAVRLVRGVQRLGLIAAAVYTPDDATSLHVAQADVAIPILDGGYNDPTLLVEAARSAGAGAVLPGYGFVSENADAARAFEEAGVRWVGPAPATIDLFGLKHTARDAAVAAGVPIVPGSPLLTSLDDALRSTEEIGFPALIKASAGGGGMGQAIAYSRADLPRAYESSVAQGESLFHNTQVYIERYISHARHIEVQIFGNGHGEAVALGERDCSVQRRRQKVMEEGPAPALDKAVRQKLRDAAVKLCAAHNYRSAGTVEFILDADTNDWYFLEVNTRLQVEHGVTELVSRIDIVEMMLRLAGGNENVLDSITTALRERGCAIEARVYAENPVKNYDPSAGVLSQMIWPAACTDSCTGSIVRVDSWAQRGTKVSTKFDPLLGKILVWGRTREMAISALVDALQSTVICGVASNIELLLQVAKNPDFVAGKYTTSLLSSMKIASSTVEVISPGMQSSLQDYPGRIGFWDVGVSPSGPMDAYSMGMANALVGNSLEACALEMTVTGPTLKFHASIVIALAGSYLRTELEDGKSIPWWTPVLIEAGSILTVGRLLAPVRSDENKKSEPRQVSGGKISYLAVRGGFDAPKYLGSTSTFPTGNFGGITGDFLKVGDLLPLGGVFKTGLLKASSEGRRLWPGWKLGSAIPEWLVPVYDTPSWEVGALNGPHGSEDFLQRPSLEDFWAQPYTVHHAANRLGVRLIGPTPKWTRQDGGSAGLHPSNLHDYTYAPGAVNLSGNTPIVLMLDGPSLGGFVCPITVASCELWKVGQAAPGTTIRFKQISYGDARYKFSCMRSAWDAVRMCDTEALSDLKSEWHPGWVKEASSAQAPAIIGKIDPSDGDETRLRVVYRVSGDEHVLIEYGEIEFNLAYRMRVHMLIEELKKLSYVKELCPGVRSLLVHYNADLKHVNDFVGELIELESGRLAPIETVAVPSRVVRLPLAFVDKWTIEAQDRYQRSVRPDAPYLPSNVEFVRRINGLQSIQEVQDIMTSAEYCVMGLGDVYLGAPCAIPLDPRHRLVTSKYNPARTYTPEGAVGIGGAYMCIYGMDSPGGYQLCGRTLPIWDSYGQIPAANRGSPPEKPWLLQFFDRVCFFLVSDDELDVLRTQYVRGDYKIEIREETFSYAEHVQFCIENKDSIDEFEKKQLDGFRTERSLWEKSGEAANNDAMDTRADASKSHIDHKEHGSDRTHEKSSNDTSSDSENSGLSRLPVLAGVSANVWAVEVTDGDVVECGQVLFVLESMKVEITVKSPVAGTVRQIQVSVGDTATADMQLCVVLSSMEDALKDLSVGKLRSSFSSGILDPSMVISVILEMASTTRGIMLSISAREDCMNRIRELSEVRQTRHLPLYGIPFVVSDDFDVRGMKTTSGCQGFQRDPHTSAEIVRVLESAGAILIGKTNLDQFSASLTGTESSFGIPKIPDAPELAPGGNAGAPIAVRMGLASFAVTTDTCGTSMIPAALSGLYALKVTEGLISLGGVVPSCPPLDCVSILASSSHDLRSVLKVCVDARSSSDLTLRKLSVPIGLLFTGLRKVETFSFGIMSLKHACFEGDDAISRANSYFTAVQKLARGGGTQREVDTSSLLAVSNLFDEVPVDAARLRAHKDLPDSSQIKRHLRPAVAECISRSKDTSATALSDCLQSVKSCIRRAERDIWSIVDVLLVPAQSRTVSIQDVAANHKLCNSIMGRHTRFITAMDLCAITVGTRLATDGLGPMGVILIAPAFREAHLLDISAKV